MKAAYTYIKTTKYTKGLKENMWKYTNMNPIASNLHATMKLHKPKTPVRPIVNWKNALHTS
jgi:hypothetical protein